jgi:Mn-dependent DtxR family transcriptional regulator
MLDRSPSAATEMLQRLDERGLVAYEPYDGVTLTDEGRAEAAELYDRYRTLVRFFRDVLGVEDAQAEAMRLAGVVSTTVADRLGSTVLADSGTGTADAPGVGSREQS